MIYGPYREKKIAFKPWSPRSTKRERAAGTSAAAIIAARESMDRALRSAQIVRAARMKR